MSDLIICDRCNIKSNNKDNPFYLGTMHLNCQERAANNAVITKQYDLCLECMRVFKIWIRSF
jgi:hypothetical protein